MECINSICLTAGDTMGMESGRELLVVVIQSTFRIPAEQGAPLRVLVKQIK